VRKQVTARGRRLRTFAQIFAELYHSLGVPAHPSQKSLSPTTTSVFRGSKLRSWLPRVVRISTWTIRTHRLRLKRKWAVDLHLSPCHSRGTARGGARQTPPVAQQRLSSSLPISQQSHSFATLHHSPFPSHQLVGTLTSTWKPSRIDGHPDHPTDPQSFSHRQALPTTVACSSCSARHQLSPILLGLEDRRMRSPTTASIGCAFFDSTSSTITTPATI
jgi:hypothetical protein